MTQKSVMDLADDCFWFDQAAKISRVRDDWSFASEPQVFRIPKRGN